jgi:hypothetical protein
VHQYKVCLHFPTVTILSFFSYYDESVLGFLQEFRRNSMLTNVHLFLCGDNRRQLNAMNQMMPRLLPSITSIESLNTYDCYDHNAALFQAGFFKKELSDMLTSARILYKWSGF